MKRKPKPVDDRPCTVIIPDMPEEERKRRELELYKFLCTIKKEQKESGP